FSGSQQCGHIHCAYQYREHYHCLDPECNYQRFTSKQDVIRHYNMHKKRDNSLQHGFMRFSPLDDCSVYYHGCHLNGKSTHYHCMQVGCTKVYTSTSDVMTHENFHKKNAQLINDGFQRFRATEDCGTIGCQFYGQKTTHFHCRRPGCIFTFKNKCDIEKHKSYHIKDDAYAKDGFKKFYKYEECKYEGCVYSKATNHFHCIRMGCGFTFTSTSQMTSHKRKHERRHIRNAGGLGLASQLLGRKENEQDDSSNDDLIDYSAISSKNSSLSASPTSQQSSAPMLLPALATAIPSAQAVKPTSNVLPATKMSTILPQTLGSSIPVALALSNAGLSGTGPFFPIIPNRVSMTLPVTAASLMSTISSNVSALSTESPSQVVSGSGNSTPLSPTATSIMEKITASKGLISPMMARLAAAALKPSNPADLGSDQQTLADQFNLVALKQAPSDTIKTQSQDSMQDRSLDLSVKEHGTESNGHMESGHTSLLSSFLNKVRANCRHLHPENKFTTEDYCETQCDFLHKTHFHCVVEDCGALFSTLDGAIKHANDPCLATDCKYANKFHFHCLFGNCKYVCKTSGKAESHCLDHINPNNNLVNVRDQFSYYSLQCLCPNQQCEFRMRGHYHCLRPFCNFVTNITTKLPWHIKKHEKAERRAANGFKYFTKREECSRLGCKYNQVNSHFHCIREGCQFSFLLKHQMTSHSRKHMRRMLGKNFDKIPNQNDDTMGNMAAATSSSAMSSTPNMMDTETEEYMDYPMGTSPAGLSSESSVPDRSCTSTPIGNESSTAGNTISLPTASGAKKRFWIIEDMSPFGKRRKTASSRKMLDEGMMLEGFKRYDLYEDCKDASCQFSLKVTHYHCTRENCGYKFCGRTHMYKHAQHHDRVDNLVLDDFKRFKSSLRCYFGDCQFSGNSTHFHCLRCGFRCTDSTKVTAHRKHHGKQDVISAAGFCQFSSSVDCEVPDCKYKLKCSHFHCTYPDCKHTVVGMSQMDSHKRKHEKLERGEMTSISPTREVMHSTSATVEYDSQGSSLNLDGSLNLSTNVDGSLFFLRNAAGIGLNDSLDLSAKPHEGVSVAGTAQEDVTATSGDAEDDNDMTQDEELNEDDDDLNTDSDSTHGTMPENVDMSEKDDATGL
ncbi:hypothetical protein scyTo_0012424, partial [Scyliorhinus torazame]|nr:hypothetical protein [Scyliorhinus torazame]